MKNNITIIIIVIVALILMFIFPVIAKEDRLSAISQLDIDEITTNFVNDIRQTGKITSQKYRKFIQNIEELEENLDIEIQFKILDKNSKEEYYTMYTSQIQQELEKENIYNLKEGDIILVTIRDNKLSFNKKIKEFFHKLYGYNNYNIIASYSAMIITNGIAIE